MNFRPHDVILSTHLKDSKTELLIVENNEETEKNNEYQHKLSSFNTGTTLISLINDSSDDET